MWQLLFSYSFFNFLLKIKKDGTVNWLELYGDNVNHKSNSVQAARDGGYIVVGYFQYPSGIVSAHVIKTDSKGNEEWAHTYDEIRGPAYSVKQTSDGGYIITGQTWTDVRGNSHILNELDDVFLVKIDQHGEIHWIRYYGMEKSADEGYSMQLTSDGGYIIVGCTGKFTPEGWLPDTNVYVIKTNSNGDTLWTRSYDNSRSADDEYGYCIQETSDGGYIICGRSINVDLPDQGMGVYLLKIDSEGRNRLWARVYGSPQQAIGNSVLETADRGFIIAGLSREEFDPRLYLIRTDSIGDTLWTFISANSNPDFAADLLQTSDTEYMVIGNAIENEKVDVYLLKIKEIAELYKGVTDDYYLSPNFPNPFNNSTFIGFRIPNAGDVTLTIYNVLGQKIRSLIDDYRDSGDYFTSWNGTNDRNEMVMSGFYICVLVCGEHRRMRKITFLK